MLCPVRDNKKGDPAFNCENESLVWFVSRRFILNQFENAHG